MTSILNVINLAEERTPAKVGIGATALGWTDRRAYTVIAISASGKTAWLREDTATRTDQNGRSESQAYAYEANPAGAVRMARLGRKGWRIGGLRGSKVLMDVRSAYHDYSF